MLSRTVRKIVAGRRATDGAARGEYVDVRFLDVELRPAAEWDVDTVLGHTAFAHLMEGSCIHEPRGKLQSARRASPFTDGDKLHMRAGPDGTLYPVPLDAEARNVRGDAVKYFHTPDRCRAALFLLTERPSMWPPTCAAAS